MTPKKYRKRAVVIEAQQYDGSMASARTIAAWSHAVVLVGGELSIHTREGIMKANVGDYIIKGVAGEFYPCAEDIFLKTYDDADKPTVLFVLQWDNGKEFDDKIEEIVGVFSTPDRWEAAMWDLQQQARYCQGNFTCMSWFLDTDMAVNMRLHREIAEQQLKERGK